jgi:uncharacterized protein (DUF58 family)
MAGGYDKNLRVAARRHDLIACPIADPREADLPDIGLQEFMDPETGALRSVDTGARSLRDAFRSQAAAEEAARTKQFQKLRMDSLALSTTKPFVEDVRRLFRRRQRRKARG